MELMSVVRVTGSIANFANSGLRLGTALISHKGAQSSVRGEAPSRDGPHCRAQCPDTSFPNNKPVGTRRHWESNPLPPALEANALPRDHQRLHMQAAFFHVGPVTRLPSVPFLFCFTVQCVCVGNVISWVLVLPTQKRVLYLQYKLFMHCICHRHGVLVCLQ